MKLIDYIYYARKINKSNYKESRTIRFGLFFSMFLILLFGLFYLWVVSISSSINNEKTVSSITCSYVKYGEETPDVYGYEEILHKGGYGVAFNNPTSSKIDYPTISIDNIDYKISNELIDKYKINVERFFTYYDNKENEKLYLDSERDYLIEHGYGDVVIAGQSFTNNKYEIMVSNVFLDALGISDYKSVIGKQISYKVLFNTGYNLNNNKFSHKVLINEGAEYTDISEEFIDYEYYVFENFKIVGVFNSMINYCYTRNIFSDSSDNYFVSDFWIKYSDINPICYEHGTELIGGKAQEDNNYIFDTNPKEIINNSKGINIVILNRNHKYSYNSAVLQFKDAESAYNYYSYVVNQYGRRSFDYNQSLKAFFELYPYYSFLRSLILILIASTILISILNVVRLIDYSINKSRDFNIMLENLGLKEKNVYLIYYIRVVYEYLKASTLLLIIGVPICIIHCIVFEKVLEANYGNVIDINIPVYGYFIVYFISFIIVYFMISFSVGIVYLINKNKLKGVIKND